jgi:hypothetical protein
MRPMPLSFAFFAALLTACATTDAPMTTEAKDRTECKEWGKTFGQDPGRMKDACLISRGYKQIYSTVLGEVYVRSIKEPRQAAQVTAEDLKTCADGTKYWDNAGWRQFEACMAPRGYTVTLN